MIWVVYDKARYAWNTSFANMLLAELNKNGFKAKLVFVENIHRYKKFPQIAIMRTDNYLSSRYLEEKGVKVCNNSKVSEICNDKYKTYLFLKENGIPVIETEEFCKEKKYSFPCVIKSKYGHGGSEVYFVNEESKVLELSKKYKDSDLIVQPLVDCGRDKRTYVIGNKLIVSMLRSSDKDFRANFSLGGKSQQTNLTDLERKMIEKVMTLFDFSLVGIDIIYKGNIPFINEIEDVVGSRMVYKNTNIDIVKEYVKYIKEIYFKQGY